MSKLADIVRKSWFAPKTWEYWRALIVCFFVFNIVGHWVELGYCVIVDSLFDIVEDDYAVWDDPWWHPYWVYGLGVVFMTLVFEPIKERLYKNGKSMWGAILKTFLLAVIVSMVLELTFGLLVNQPDAYGEYPYWNNEKLPLNVLNQAWLVNDFFLGLVGTFYVWFVFPLVCAGFERLKPRTANIVFAAITVAFAICCFTSYLQIIASGRL